ncbi:MAG: Flp pilus assembly complex ATPase component TadA [Candidatus Omnitrophica bacterium]|nr:Flp pilus assembly complex ATPase component TadA [Candidatus Omnitrophota bacterium]
MKSKMITFFSHKGGVGKTFIAVNAAISLALNKKKVLLLELNFQSAHDIDKMLGTPARYGLINISKQLKNNSDPDLLSRAITSHKSGLHFLPAIINTAQITQFTSAQMHDFFTIASKEYDYIIVDTRRALNEALVATLQNSNLILMVTTPDDLLCHSFSWSLGMFEKVNVPKDMIKLIVNRAATRGMDPETIEKKIGLSIIAQIPSDGKTVGSALNRGIPCIIDFPQAEVSRRIEALTKKFENKELFHELTDFGDIDLQSQSDSAELWKKIGVTTKVSAAVQEAVDEEGLLKKEIHDQLVEVMNIDRMSSKIFNDAERMTEMREQASKIVEEMLKELSDEMVLNEKERLRMTSEIVSETFGLGALEEFLDDDDISDIMVNSQHKVYIEKYGKLIKTKAKFLSEEQMRAIIDRIISPLGRRIDESNPMVDARLLDGSRFNAIIPPLSLTGPVITIRKFGRTRPTVDDLLNKFNSLNVDMRDFIEACVTARKNIIVSGGTGSGKTTLLNIVSTFIPDNERIVTIEDAAELRINKRHWLRLESRPPNLEGKGAVPIRRLFMNSLHMRPDRIIVGECRGPEVLDMLQAMNTGHDGSMTTLHANSPQDCLTRMSSMILLAGIDLPMRAIQEMIATALDLIVHVNRFADGSRKIVAISEITGLDKDHYIDLKEIFKFDPHGMDKDATILGDYIATGYVPKCNEEFKTLAIPLDEGMFARHHKKA